MSCNTPRKAPALNPDGEHRYPGEEPRRGKNASPKAMAQEGYRILDRAEPRSPFYDKGRPGLSEPVYNLSGYGPSYED